MLGDFLFFMWDILWGWCNQSHNKHEVDKQMTNDEIIRMAMVAGFNVTSERATKGFCGFAALVAAHEREACLACYSPDDTATDWADKIRARGEK